MLIEPCSDLGKGPTPLGNSKHHGVLLCSFSDHILAARLEYHSGKDISGSFVPIKEGMIDYNTLQNRRSLVNWFWIEFNPIKCRTYSRQG